MPLGAGAPPEGETPDWPGPAGTVGAPLWPGGQGLVLMVGTTGTEELMGGAVGMTEDSQGVSVGMGPAGTELELMGAGTLEVTTGGTEELVVMAPTLLAGVDEVRPGQLVTVGWHEVMVTSSVT